MQNVMNAFLAVMLIVPVIMLIFSLVSFTQEGQIRDVSYIQRLSSQQDECVVDMVRHQDMRPSRLIFFPSDLDL